MPLKLQKNTGTYPAPVPPGGTGTPPTVVLVTPTATTGIAPHSVIAQGFGTTAGNSAITSYAFDWGDGTAVTNATKNINGTNVPIPIAYHRYTAAGTYTLSLTVADVNGNLVTQTRTITVTARPAHTVTINPGDNITNALNNAAVGAIIKINAGTYTATGSWNPKNDQVVFANGAVTVSGGGTVGTFAAFMNTGATGVRVQGLRITAFSFWALYFNTGSAIFQDCEVDTCGVNGTVSGGLNGYLASVIVLDNCHFHDNKSYGMAGGSGATHYVMGGEYDHNFNDTSGSFSPLTDDGVWKNVHVPADYVVGVNAHDNQGHALWWDGSNVNVYVCLCTVTSNYGNGIFSEINNAAAGGVAMNLSGNLDGSGFSFRWLFNTLTGNGYPATSFFPTGNIYPANLFVSKSDKIEIAYNWIDGGAHGIALDYQVSRAEGHNLANISVHDNDIRLRETGASGAGSGAGLVGFHNSFAGTAYSLTAVTFSNNHYFAAHDNATWEHFIVYTGTSEVNNTFAQWKANGYDTVGSTMALDTAWPH